MKVYVCFDKKKEIYSVFSGEEPKRKGIIFSYDIRERNSNLVEDSRLELFINSCNKILSTIKTKKGAKCLIEANLTGLGIRYSLV